MQVPFLTLEAQVPDGWQDASTVLYTMPEAAPSSAIPGKASAGSPASVAITWENTSTLSASAYLQERLGQLKQSLKGLRVEEVGNAGDGNNPIPFAQVTLVAQVPLTQILLVRRVQDRIICVTGTAQAVLFAELREQFIATARSLRARG